MDFIPLNNANYNFTILLNHSNSNLNSNCDIIHWTKRNRTSDSYTN